MRSAAAWAAEAIEDALPLVMLLLSPVVPSPPFSVKSAWLAKNRKEW
jgi:hypothetical protein